MRKHSGMSLMALTLAFSGCLGPVGKVRAQAQKDPANAALAFEKIKTLVGRWEATTDRGKASGTYELVSGGSAFDPKTNRIDFQFLDATNLPSPDAGHMHQVVVRFQGPGEVTEDWTFYKGGKAAFTVPLDYHRVN